MSSPGNAGGKPQPAHLRALQHLGLDAGQRRAFFQGEAVVYYFPTWGSPAIAILQLVDARLRSGIVDIHDVDGGIGDFIRLRTRSFAVAQALGAVALELFGAALINPRLEALLLRHGFSRATEAVPAVLGGGTMEIVTKVFAVQQSR